MTKVTSKLQITIPKRVAEAIGIEPGDELDLQPAGSMIRMVPAKHARNLLPVEERLRVFDEATERQAERQARWAEVETRQGTQHDASVPYGRVNAQEQRGWTRDEVYADRLDRVE